MRRSTIALVACVAGSLAGVRAAHADSAADQELARALFRAARQLETSGDYPSACKRFEESLRLDVGVGTKFNLADCYEHTERPLAAKKLFLDVATLTHEAGNAEREGAARERAAALDAAIPKLVVSITSRVDGLEVKRDGAIVDPKDLGTEVQVEPGKHHLEATAPKRKPWTADVEVAMDVSPVTVKVPELDRDGAPERTPKKNSAPTSTSKSESSGEKPKAPAKTAPARALPTERTDDHTLPILLYSGIGVGAVVAGTSLAFYESANGRAKKICPTGYGCSADDVHRHGDLIHEAQIARNVAYVGFGVAGLSAIGAAVVAFTRSPAREGKAQAWTAAPMAGPGIVGADVEGAF